MELNADVSKKKIIYGYCKFFFLFVQKALLRIYVSINLFLDEGALFTMNRSHEGTMQF